VQTMLGTREPSVVSDRSRLRRRCREPSRPNTDLSLTTLPGALPTLSAGLLNPRLAMVLNPESKYPYQRAYVLNLRGDATADSLAGRIENMVTGRHREFASAQELLASITFDLAPVADSALGMSRSNEASARDADRSATQS